MSTRKFLNVRASAPIVSAVLAMTAACSSEHRQRDTQGSVAPLDTVSESATAAEEHMQQPYRADYDIAMTVSSVADAINVGEPLDSLDYNFAGVLTDAMGTPLFTDFSGLPGQWEVTVVNKHELKIRNKGTGDLSPDMLVDYLTATLVDRSEGIMEKVGEYDEGDTRISEYTYGRTALRVETRPELLATGEVGPRLEITLRSDTVAQPQSVNPEMKNTLSTETKKQDNT